MAISLRRTRTTSPTTGSSQSVDEISRKLADTGAVLVSLPFQYNCLGDAGPGGDDYDNHDPAFRAIHKTKKWTWAGCSIT